MLATATIRDPAGNLYTNATVECSFVSNAPAGSNQYYSSAGSPFQTFATAKTDSFGVLSTNLTGNDVITPAGSQWRFVVFSNTTPVVGFGVNIALAGSSQDVSATLQAAAASLPNTNFGNVTALSIFSKNIETIRFADQFGSLAAAIADLPATGGAVFL